MSALNWQSVLERMPDDDTTVLCWTEEGEWFSGWFDGEGWRDCSTGGDLQGVTHWAEPEGPAP